MPIALFQEESDEITRRLLEVNLHGVINGSREAMRRMLARGDGHLINVSSTLGKVALPGGATYSATKYGVVGLTEAIRQELRGTGVDVSLVMPAVVRTELSPGLKSVHGITAIGPDDVAAAIAKAIQRPRFEVYVAQSVGRIAAVIQPMPRPIRESFAKSLKADRLLTESLRSAERTQYEQRAAGRG